MGPNLCFTQNSSIQLGVYFKQTLSPNAYRLDPWTIHDLHLFLDNMSILTKFLHYDLGVWNGIQQARRDFLPIAVGQTKFILQTWCHSPRLQWAPIKVMSSQQTVYRWPEDVIAYYDDIVVDDIDLWCMTEEIHFVRNIWNYWEYVHCGHEGGVWKKLIQMCVDVVPSYSFTTPVNQSLLIWDQNSKSTWLYT